MTIGGFWRDHWTLWPGCSGVFLIRGRHSQVLLLFRERVSTPPAKRCKNTWWQLMRRGSKRRNFRKIEWHLLKSRTHVWSEQARTALGEPYFRARENFNGPWTKMPDCEQTTKQWQHSFSTWGTKPGPSSPSDQRLWSACQRMAAT